jgi:hypothetical protein
MSPCLALAATPVIGTVTAPGAFRIDNATITGNATLFEGATVETRVVSTSMVLPGRARVTLAPESRARIFGDHMILEKGAGLLDQATGFSIEARRLTVQPGIGSASARVALAGPLRVQVAAVIGPFRVLNQRGVLVANVSPGEALEFEPQADSTATKLTGRLLHKDGHWLLTDETTHVTAELVGRGLGDEEGNCVQVAGELDASVTPVSEASQFIRIAEIKHLEKGCSAPAAKTKSGRGAAAAGAGGAAGKAAGAAGTGGGAAGGTAVITTIAIVGGVAVAAAVGGLAAASALPGQGASTPISH